MSGTEVVFDIETIGDLKDLGSQKITVVSVYRYEDDSYQSFEESELGDLWPILEKAERIIGFNSEHFDLPILNKYYAGDLLRFSHLDILKVVKESTGSRFKLNDLAKATLQMEKSANGLQAQKWFEEGRIDEVKKYCEQDVRVTKELYEYGRKNRMLYYETLTGELRPFAVDFDMPRLFNAAIQQGGKNFNLTLPF
ncbi:MAG: ribonuclease H-like domain-containing protein [Candidatus Magasanikbacteria bacterium]|nr:ribonuclease H-like domain-containing protein [Candidatus Magasanikbacteria bacterium]